MQYATVLSQKYNDRLKNVVPGGTHYSFRKPLEYVQLHFARGFGSRIWDMDGNEYLDFNAKFGANILGHNNSRYNGSLTAVLNGVAAVNLGTAECEAAEMICEHVPSAEMVRFSLSGTEAVQNALRLARAYTKGQNPFAFSLTIMGTPTTCLADGSEISQILSQKSSLETSMIPTARRRGRRTSPFSCRGTTQAFSTTF